MHAHVQLDVKSVPAYEDVSFSGMRHHGFPLTIPSFRRSKNCRTLLQDLDDDDNAFLPKLSSSSSGVPSSIRRLWT